MIIDEPPCRVALTFSPRESQSYARLCVVPQVERLTRIERIPISTRLLKRRARRINGLDLINTLKKLSREALTCMPCDVTVTARGGQLRRLVIGVTAFELTIAMLPGYLFGKPPPANHRRVALRRHDVAG